MKEQARYIRHSKIVLPAASEGRKHSSSELLSGRALRAIHSVINGEIAKRVLRGK